MEAKIKICKILDVETAIYCEELGVNYLGLHHIKGPIQEKKIELFKEIKSNVKLTELVLVTQEQNFEYLLDICSAFEFDYIQLHFPTRLQDITELKYKLKQNKIKSGLISVFTKENIEQENLKQLSKEVDFLLFDSSFRGGTGLLNSDEMIRIINEKAGGIKYFFAGGLNHLNVKDKIKQVRPYSVDVQSGVELKDKSGIKDFDLIKKFVLSVKNEN